MHKRYIVILLVLATCACGRTQDAPRLVDPAAVEAYHKADQALLERARQGVRSSVTLVRADGGLIEGFDEIISGAPNRMREVRPDYEAVGVGDVICKQARGSNTPVCEEGEFVPGLMELVDSAILRAKSTVAACGHATCRRIWIEQTYTPWSEIEKALKREQESVEEGRRVIVLLITADGLPYSLSAWEWSGGQRVEVEATYLFDYNTPVSPIELPSQVSAASSP